MEPKVEWFTHNWWHSQEAGEEFNQYHINNSDVKNIEYHQPAGEGDRHYCDVLYNDGTMKRCFNPNEIGFKTEVDTSL